MNSVDRKRGRGNCHVKNNVFSFCNMNETNNYRDHEKEKKETATRPMRKQGHIYM